MTAIFSTDSKLYQTPSEIVRQNRKQFYSSQKENTESISKWLCRIGQYSQDCEFGARSDFLLIDKFICELNSEEIQKFQNVSTWSLEQLYKAAAEEPQTHVENCKTETTEIESDCPIVDILEIDLNAVS